MLRMRRIGLALVIVLSANLYAQQTPAPQKAAESTAPASANTPATLIFKSHSDLVLVPVVVRGHKGKYIAGLSRDRFRLEENGKEQAITLFEEVHPLTADYTSPPASDRGYSNLPFDGTRPVGLTIIALDLLNSSPIQREDGKEQIVKFLSHGLAPNQTVSLLCITSKGIKPVHPFTTNTNSLIEAIRKTPLGAGSIMSGQDTSTPGPFRENLVLSTIGQIKEIAQAYVGIPGRKTLILAAAAIPGLATESQIWDSSVLAGDLRQMWNSLIEANISIYPIHLMEWSRNPNRGGVTGRLDINLDQFANSTGGKRCIEANDLIGCLSEAVDDSRSYYMLGFSVQPDDRKPGWRYLKVKVSAEHADVRARNGFYYGTPPAEVPKRSEEINTLASPLPHSAVPMYVKVLPPPVAPSPNSAPSSSGKTMVEFLMTIPLGSVTVDRSRRTPLDLEIGAVALTKDIKEAAEFLEPVRGNPTTEDLQRWAHEGLRLQAKLDLPPGSYDIRFFARDNNTDQIGTVVFPLDVK